MFDLVIRNGKIVDGTGGPWFKADLSCKDGVIAQINNLAEAQAKNEVDAAGKIVTPGFIDAHSHTDFIAAVINNSDSRIHQGVTTEIVGMCGRTPAPVASDKLDHLKNHLAPFIPKQVEYNWHWQSTGDWLDIIDKQGHSTELGIFAGHGTIRLAVMGFENRTPTASEMARMKTLLKEAMDNGALGMSSGLIYPPGIYTSKEELVELCKVTAAGNGIYATHLRNEGNELIEAVREALEIGRLSGCPVHISHHKASGKNNFGKVNTTLNLMEEARSDGIDVTCDLYPYLAGSTLISALLPAWVHEGGVEQMIERASDSSSRKRIANELEKEATGWENLVKGAGWNHILICSSPSNTGFEGKTIGKCAREEGIPAVELMLDLIISDQGQTTIALFMLNEDNLKTVLTHRLSMIGSDGFGASYTGVLARGKPHPRAFGTFPKVLGKYVREEGVLTLEEAVWKMTGFPAQRFGLFDRGVLRPGAKADLVIFDSDLIIDQADFKNPYQKPKGIDSVYINSKPVVNKGIYSGDTFGRSIRKNKTN